jgi:hypothetical protein
MQFNKTILKICLVISCLLLNISAVGLPRFDGATSFMETEIWKEIPDLGGFYFVSNLGRIKSIERSFPINFKNTDKFRVKPEMILKSHDKRGYRFACITYNMVTNNFPIHRLVASLFIRKPNKNEQVNHIDGDKANNHVSNLEWVSPLENITHAWKNNLIPHGEQRHDSKLSNNDVLQIRNSKETSIVLGKRYSVSSSTIRNIKLNKSWKRI